MAWGRIDDKLHSSTKWRRTSKGGRALWATGISWCMDQLTDGHIPADMVRILDGTTTEAKALVDAGFWHAPGHKCDKCPPIKDGWLYHDWLEYQPSRESVLADRAAAAERQKRAREKARESRNSHAVTTPVSHGVSHAIVTPLVTVPPTQPNPTQPNKGLSDLGGEPKQQRTFPPQACGESHDPAKSCGACADARRTNRANDSQAAKDATRRQRAAETLADQQRKADAAQALAEAQANPEATQAAKARAFAAVGTTTKEQA